MCNKLKPIISLLKNNTGQGWWSKLMKIISCVYLICSKRKVFCKLSPFCHVLKYYRYLFTLLFLSIYLCFLDKETNKKNNTEKWHEETITKRQNERKIFHGNEKWDRFNGTLIKESRTTLSLRTSFPFPTVRMQRVEFTIKVLYFKVLEIHHFYGWNTIDTIKNRI